VVVGSSFLGLEIIYSHCSLVDFEVNSLDSAQIERNSMVNMVRDGQLVAVACSECGCRLEQMEDGHWRHFGVKFTGKDARGCKCPNVNLPGSFNSWNKDVIFTRWSCSSC